VQQPVALAGVVVNQTMPTLPPTFTFTRTAGPPRGTAPPSPFIIANRGALEDAERTVNQMQSFWERRLTSPAAAALTDADERWRALDPGRCIELA